MVRFLLFYPHTISVREIRLRYSDWPKATLALGEYGRSLNQLSSNGACPMGHVLHTAVE